MFIDTTSDVATRVTGAIREAARITGAGFDYLLKTALRESNFDPDSKAATSSATGLFQFIDQTWLGMLKSTGAGVGYGRYAEAISQTSSGKYVVVDPQTHREIMALRKDPTANAVMAGLFTTRNAAELNEALGRKPTDGELYMAHFLGANGATRFISAATKTPDAPAAPSFPEAARANRSIFYDRWGMARTFSQVYARLAKLHDNGTVPVAVTAVAAPAPVMSPAAAPVPGAPARVTVVPPVQAVTPPARAQVIARSGLPVFHDLFRSEGRGGVAPGVAALWAAPRLSVPAQTVAAVTPPAAAAPSARADRRHGAPLDLFQFLRPDIQNLVRRS